ncbi:MAG: hypothetical protein SGBAC_005333 [Bacillariaceae sp.]
MEVTATIVESDDESSVEDKPSNRKPVLICIIVFLVLGIGGVLAWFFLGRAASDATSLENQVRAPAIPSQAPSWNPTSVPSDIPSKIPQLFDPPSQEDCILIQNQLAVDNQNSMIPTPFGFDFDVTIVEGTENALWIATFMTALIRNLVPDLTGCSTRRLLLLQEESSPSSWQQQDHHDYYHRNLNEIRYAIGNVNVTGEFQLGRACEDDAVDPCFRFVVKMDLYIKDVLSDFRLIELLVGIIDPPESTETLAQRMGLPTDVIRSVAVVLLGSTTESPTAAPIAPPTTAPIALPIPNVTLPAT